MSRKLLSVALTLGAFSLASAADVTEEQYDKAMKATLAGMQAMGKGVREGNMTAVADGAKAIDASLASIESYWTTRKAQDAIDAGAAGRKAAQAIAAAAAANDAEKVKASTTALQGSCRTCHDAYRVKNEDGSYSIKK
jgi:cytochrome c556